ncbi:hypothetical protein, partial [Deinococcus aquatilis]|uniref:hypothetical protein n=1 Tax=Deinococcus aquatilis TaxID=519440 RepID=UPI001B7FADD3
NLAHSFHWELVLVLLDEVEDQGCLAKKASAFLCVGPDPSHFGWSGLSQVNKPVLFSSLSRPHFRSGRPGLFLCNAEPSPRPKSLYHKNSAEKDCA